MHSLRPLGVAAWIAVFVCTSLSLAQRKKKGSEEEITQTLEIPPDPPLALTAAVERLGFVTAPLTVKGLLSQQVRDSLKALFVAAHGAPIVKIRALVAGTGDLRRVQAIVSEVFTEKRQALPVLSVVQVGGLPLDGAQVQMEAWTQEKKPTNPAGVAFLSGQQVVSEAPTPAVKGLVEKSVANLKTALEASDSSPGDVLRVTCFLTSLEDVQDVRQVVGAAFPKAPAAYAQTQRAPAQSLVECEAVARVRKATGERLRLLNPTGLTVSPNYSQVAIVGPGTVVLAGAQLAFRYTEPDARLAFQRLERTLQSSGTSLKQVAFMNTYPLSPLLVELVRKVRFDYLDRNHPPASTMLAFEGLPSMDGAFSLEVVALPGP